MSNYLTDAEVYALKVVTGRAYTADIHEQAATLINRGLIERIDQGADDWVYRSTPTGDAALAAAMVRQSLCTG